MTSPFTSLFSQVLQRNEGQVHKLLSPSDITKVRNDLYENTIVNIDEAQELSRFYHSNISKTCQTFDLPITTQLVAHVLLLKYSLKHSVLARDIKHVMLTCCYLAAKLDNIRLVFSDFCNNIKNTNPSLIEVNEFVLLEMLDFQPWIFSAYPCVLGFALEIGALNQLNHEDLDKLLIQIYQTDVPLIFNESHIALFVLVELLSLEAVAHLIEELGVNMEQIKSFLIQQPLDMATLKQVDKRIWEFRNSNKNSV